MMCASRMRIVALALSLAIAISVPAQTSTQAESGPLPMLAQATVPPTGMMDAEHPMPLPTVLALETPERLLIKATKMWGTASLG